MIIALFKILLNLNIKLTTKNETLGAFRFKTILRK